MRYGTTRAYIYSASQIANDIISQEKLSGVITQTRARAYRDVSVQAISAITETKVQFNAETFDPASMFDSTTNYRFTVTFGLWGFYLIHAEVALAAPASNSFYQVSIYKNGAKVCLNQALVLTGVGQPTCQITDFLYLTTADYIEIYLYLGVASSVQNGSDRTWLDVIRIF